MREHENHVKVQFIKKWYRETTGHNPSGYHYWDFVFADCDNVDCEYTAYNTLENAKQDCRDWIDDLIAGINEEREEYGEKQFNGTIRVYIMA